MKYELRGARRPGQVKTEPINEFDTLFAAREAGREIIRNATFGNPDDITFVEVMHDNRRTWFGWKRPEVIIPVAGLFDEG